MNILALRRRPWAVQQLLIGLIVSILLVGIRQVRSPRTATIASSPDATAQTSEGGGVTIVVTPQAMNAAIAFTIALDTHSVDLDGYNLSNLARLRVDGMELRPTTWDAPKGGHHREGRLVFPASTINGPMELVIRDVAGVAERSFRWPSQ